MIVNFRLIDEGSADRSLCMAPPCSLLSRPSFGRALFPHRWLGAFACDASFLELTLALPSSAPRHCGVAVWTRATGEQATVFVRPAHWGQSAVANGMVP